MAESAGALAGYTIFKNQRDSTACSAWEINFSIIARSI
jgi:hypothetical protein